MKFQFDKLISAPCRLGILATLVPGESVSFSEMKSATSLSDGNLHAQTRKLDDAGYIKITKIMKGRRSVTEFRITGLGRERRFSTQRRSPREACSALHDQMTRRFGHETSTENCNRRRSRWF
jgi:DNA-binding MarR family transcriptional regulator